MGLLDQFSEFAKTPEGQGLLSAAFGGLAGARRGTPLNNIGRGGLAGLSGYGNAIDRQSQEGEQAFQKQFRQMQMDDMQAKAQQKRDEQAWRGGLPGVMKQAETSYGAGEEGPTMTPGDPKALDQYLLDPRSPFADEVLKQKIMPKERKLRTVGNVVLDESTMQPVYTQPDKVNPNQPFMVVDGQVVPNKAFQEYETSRARAGASSTNVNVNSGQKDVQWGAPPKDMIWARDQSGQVVTERDQATGAFRPLALPIAGSKDDVERGANDAKSIERAKGARAAAQNVLSAVADAKNMIGGMTSGVASPLSAIPGTGARDLQSRLETIKANLGFDRLQQMRDQSPTGGALGSVAVQELTALQSTVSSLDQGQSPAQLKASIQKIEGHYNRWLNTLEGKLPDDEKASNDKQSSMSSDGWSAKKK